MVISPTHISSDAYAFLRIRSFGSHYPCDAFVVRNDAVPFQHLTYHGGSITIHVLEENLGYDFRMSFVLCHPFVSVSSEKFVVPTS